ncbi:Transposase and inactivated derivatives, partial [Thermoflexus hugenholtzii JAD2]
MQELVQWVLAAEVTELWGRARCQRRAEVGALPGYRNGYGKPRQLTTPLGTVTLRQPRVRGLEERFVSRILPLFARRTQEVGELLPELHLHGLAEGDFDLALRGLLRRGRFPVREHGGPAEGAVAGRVGGVAEEVAGGSGAGVPVGGWGICASGAGEGEGGGAGSDRRVGGRPEGGGERGAGGSGTCGTGELRAPQRVITDGHLGIWGAVRNIWPETAKQRCWNHKILNVLDPLPKTQQMLRAVAHAPSRKEADHQRQAFEAWCQRQ